MSAVAAGRHAVHAGRGAGRVAPCRRVLPLGRAAAMAVTFAGADTTTNAIHSEGIQHHLRGREPNALDVPELTLAVVVDLAHGDAVLVLAQAGLEHDLLFGIGVGRVARLGMHGGGQDDVAVAVAVSGMMTLGLCIWLMSSIVAAGIGRCGPGRCRLNRWRRWWRRWWRYHTTGNTNATTTGNTTLLLTSARPNAKVMSLLLLRGVYRCDPSLGAARRQDRIARIARHQERAGVAAAAGVAANPAGAGGSRHGTGSGTTCIAAAVRIVIGIT